jgi:hypothetical protein
MLNHPQFLLTINLQADSYIFLFYFFESLRVLKKVPHINLTLYDIEEAIIKSRNYLFK